MADPAVKPSPLPAVTLDAEFEAMTPRERGLLLIRTLAALLIEASDHDDPLMTRAEAAEYAGVEPETVRVWCVDHGLGHFDRVWLIRRSDLDKYLQRRADRLKKRR